LRLNGKPQLCFQADGTQEAYRIIPKCRRQRGAQQLCSQIGKPSRGVGYPPMPHNVVGQSVDGEISGRQVCTQITAAPARHIHDHNMTIIVAQDRASCIALFIQSIERTAEAVCHATGQIQATKGHNQIQIVAGAPQQTIAHVATD